MAEQFGVPGAGVGLDGSQPNDDGDNLVELAFRLFMTYVRPYLWLYAVTVILFLAAGYVFLKTATPIYESTAQMLISSGETKAINVDGMDDPTSGIQGDIFLRTQMMVMQSDAILNQVYERMGMLGEDSLKVIGPKIEREVGTSLVNIKARSEDKEAAAKFANTVAEVYMDFMFKRRSSLSSTGVDLLRDQLKEVQDSSQKAMDEFLKFKEEHGIFDLRQTYDTLNRQKLDLTNKIFDAELDADEIKMSLEEIEANRKIAVIMLPYLIPQNSTATLNNIQQMILNHQMDLPKLMTQYSEAHQVIQVHGKVGELLDKAAEDQVDISVNGLKLKYQRTLKLKEKLNQQIKEIEQRLVELDRLSGDYRIRENAVNKLDQTISNITGRINDIQIAEATTIGNYAISRVNDAKLADFPAFPRPKIILALAFLLGIVVAAGTAFILVFLNDKVTEREELSSAFLNQVTV
ncbi:MAG: hypothetical protein IJJ33_19590, partial [Victivallales bacterium]|nr:hypothetical protein [Victivallales bacterium]